MIAWHQRARHRLAREQKRESGPCVPFSFRGALSIVMLCLVGLLLADIDTSSAGIGRASVRFAESAGRPALEVVAPGSGASASTPTAVPTPPPCGLAWRVVPSPNVEGSLVTYLKKVTAVGPDNVWAAGLYQYRTDRVYSQAFSMRWDSSQWNIVHSPIITNSRPSDIEAISADDVWMVGSVGGGSLLPTLTMHWDGAVWSRIPSPNGTTTYWNSLDGVSALSRDNVWAVGQYHISDTRSRTLIERWDGAQWSIVPSPNQSKDTQSLNSVVALAPNDVWAVGAVGDRSYQVNPVLIVHWDGNAWSVVPTLNPGINNHLQAVAAISANDVWAVGSYNSGTANSSRTLIQHWDGSQWNRVPSPNFDTLTSHYLEDVVALAANDVWAVGYRVRDNGNTYDTLFLHWDGSQWSIVPSPNRDPVNILTGITAVSANDLWAVGTSGPDSTRSLTMRWNDPCAGGTPSPTPSYTPVPTLSPTAVPCTLAFSDVPQKNTFYAPIRCLACRGIISGYSDGTFRPNNLVTRGQLAKIVSNAAGFAEGPDPQIFEDVPPANTFYQWINRLTRRGYMSGYACGRPGEPCVNGDRPYFRPGANATRGQTSKIVANAAQYTEEPTEQTFEDVPPTHTFYREIQRLASRNIMGGYPCGGPGEPCLSGKPYFRPGNDVTRGQSAKIVANTFYPNCVTP